MAESPPPYNDLTYFTFGTPDGSKPTIQLEELGLKYKCVTIDILKNEQKQDWFLAINPNGKIPALKDGELRVFESGAIMLYLAEHYDTEQKFTFQHGTPEYWEMVGWLMFQIGGIGPMHGQAYHFRAMAEARSDHGIKRFIDEVKREYSVLETRLSTADWLVSDKYTIADMANYSWVRTGPIILAIDLNEFPGVERWVSRIEGREAVQRALKIPEGTMSKEELAEMFRGLRAKMDGMENSDKH